MPAIAMTTKTAHGYIIELLTSMPDGEAFLCFQFQTVVGPTPVFSIPVKSASHDDLEKIQQLIDALTSTVGRSQLQDFVAHDLAAAD